MSCASPHRSAKATRRMLVAVTYRDRWIENSSPPSQRRAPNGERREERAEEERAEEERAEEERRTGGQEDRRRGER
jgi:hypothetical protein